MKYKRKKFRRQPQKIPATAGHSPPRTHAIRLDTRRLMLPRAMEVRRNRFR